MAELNAKVQVLEEQFNAAVEEKEGAIRESERCQLKLQLANRLISALASEGMPSSRSFWHRALPTNVRVNLVPMQTMRLDLHIMQYFGVSRTDLWYQPPCYLGADSCLLFHCILQVNVGQELWRTCDRTMMS